MVASRREAGVTRQQPTIETVAGTMSDAEAAALLGITRQEVLAYRVAHGVKRHRRQLPDRRRMPTRRVGRPSSCGAAAPMALSRSSWSTRLLS